MSRADGHLRFCISEGEYLMAQRAIHCASQISGRHRWALGPEVVDILTGHCMDRPSRLPAGSVIRSSVIGIEQSFVELGAAA